MSMCVVFVEQGAAIIRWGRRRVEHNTGWDRTENSDGFETGMKLVTGLS